MVYLLLVLLFLEIKKIKLWKWPVNWSFSELFYLFCFVPSALNLKNYSRKSTNKKIWPNTLSGHVNFLLQLNIITNSSLIRYQILYCFSHPTNHQHVAVKRLYVHKTRITRKISSGVSYPIRTNPACSVTKTRFQFESCA